MEASTPLERTSALSIGEVLTNAIVFNPHAQVQLAMHAEPIQDQAAALFALLEDRQVAYVLVGGLAMLQHVPGRNTQDIDLIMALDDLQRLPELVLASSDANFARARYGDLVVDLLLTSNRLFETVRSRFVEVRSFVERDIPCATVEGLLLLKLYALPSLYRQGDFTRVNLYEGDIAALLYEYEPAMEPLLTLLAPHLSASDNVAVADIVTDAQARVRRFKQSER